VKSTALLAGLATLATAAAALAVPTAATSAAPQEPSAIRQAHQGAAGWVASHGKLVKKAPADDLVRTATYPGGNGTFAVAYERTHEGLPVVGGDFVVVTDSDGNVLSSSVAQSKPVDLASTTAAVSADKATRISRGELDRADTAEAPRLVVWQDGGASHLAWETTVAGQDAGEVSRQSVYVDARDASVLGSTEHVVHGQGNAAYSGPNPLTLNTSLSGSTYSLKDPASTTRVCQDAATNVTFSGTDDVWGNGSSTSKETGCVDGFYATQMMKGMLTDWLGRNGENGSGGWVPMRVGLNDVNAYYDGTQVQIGHSQTGGRWISSIDVVAHEYGHGIDDKTPGGISGNGTQEFIGDVFGALTEHYSNQSSTYDGPDYLVGEEIDLVGQGPIRNMYNPAAVGDPNCYSSAIPTTEVHAAAGPGNHWFYLLAEGSAPAGKPASPTCNGSSLAGIGIQKAGTIVYNAMLMKTTGASYLKYRTWTLTAAKNLYPASCAEFNAVKAAWDAVSVPAQAGDPTCGTTPPPTGGNLLVNPGFESGATGWTGTTGLITTNTGRPARTGSYKAWLGGNGTTTTENIQQTVTIPSTATAASLSYWIRTDTAESGSTVYDTMKVQVIDGATTTTLRTFSNVGTNATYTQYSHSLLAYKGRSVIVKFLMNEDSSLQTSFVVDDTAVNAS
jgi:Zn-dependent metalloprotease